MTAGPVRVAVGVPLHNGAEHLAEALESLLLQSYRDFALVLVDDCSTDATPELAARYAQLDERIAYRRNEQRLGLAANWSRAFELAVQEAPGCEYFAWGSDHDVWHPHWLEALVEALDADATLVGAFPLSIHIRNGARGPLGKRRWDTTRLADPVRRVHAVLREPRLRPGDMIYGLFRASAIERCGVFPSVLLGDRLLLAQLAALGRFGQVPRLLWERRVTAEPTPKRQRRSLFGGRAPLHAYLPVDLVHAACLFRWAVLRGAARPEAGRRLGLRVALVPLGGEELRRRIAGLLARHRPGSLR